MNATIIPKETAMYKGIKVQAQDHLKIPSNLNRTEKSVAQPRHKSVVIIHLGKIDFIVLPLLLIIA